MNWTVLARRVPQIDPRGVFATLVAVLMMASVAAAGATGAVAATQSTTVTVDAPSEVTAGSTADGQLVTGTAEPVGSFKIVLTYDDSTLSVSASGTDRFTVETDHQTGKLVIVGYTNKSSGTTTTLANLDITGDASADSTTIDVRVETFTDTDGNSLPAAGKSTSLAVAEATTATPTPTPTPTSGSTGGSAGGGGGGGGGGSGETASANVVSTSDGATINIRDAAGGSSLSVSVPNVATDTAAVTGLDIEMTFAVSRFRVEFTKPTASPPSGAPKLADKGTAVQYFSADAIGARDADIDTAEFTFTVKKSALPEGASPDDVRLFRYNNGEWQALDTRSLGNGKYVASSPGFSAFAIGTASSESAATPTPTPTSTAASTATPTPTAETSTSTPTSTTSSSSQTFPGFGIPMTVFALLAVAYLVRRRR